jgi:acetyl esterase/lipase
MSATADRRDGVVDATLDPALQALLDDVPVGTPDFWELGPDGARAAMGERIDVGEPAAVDVVPLAIPAPHGVVPSRLYRPDSERSAALEVFFHGGGWMGGSAEVWDHRLRRLAVDSGVTILSVDYRLAPEHPFPAALDDSAVATEWAVAELGRYGIDGRFVGVGGDSAGGNLAGAVAQRLRDRGGPRLDHQLLIYPVVARRFDSASYERWAEGFFLTKATMQWFWDHYVGEATPRYADLLAGADLAGLPPTTVLTCTHDPLCSEGEAYAAGLAAAGVPVVLQRHSGLIHGVWNFATTVPSAQRFARAIASALRDAATPTDLPRRLDPGDL